MLATQIADARAKRGWTVSELAARAGLSSQQVRRVENGVGSTSSVQSICLALDLVISHTPFATTVTAQIKSQRTRLQKSINEVSSKSRLSRMTIRSIELGSGSMKSLDAIIGVLAPNARLKEPPRASWHRTAQKNGDDQFTPPAFLDIVTGVFGRIDLDPSWHPSSKVNAARKICLSEGGDGLAAPWDAKLVWLNPPYSELLKWLRKADIEWSIGRAKQIVCLVPARTDSSFFHDRLLAVADVYLLRRRLRFIQLDGRPGNQAPFPLMMVFFGATAGQRNAVSMQIEGVWMPRIPVPIDA